MAGSCGDQRIRTACCPLAIASTDCQTRAMQAIDVHSLGAYIREQRNAAQVSIRELARTAGVSNPYLSQVERGLKKPSAEILAQIAKGLRISAETLYVRAGLLDERVGDAAVTAAIASDFTLSERQKQVLLEIYAAFQTENAATTKTPAKTGKSRKDAS
jgi:transcriptional regulator with XRE-family HTH domain